MFLDGFPLCAELIQEYSDLRHGGKTAAEVVDCLKNTYANERQDPDDGPLFWLGIAAAQEAWQETSADVVEEVERSLSQLKKTAWMSMKLPALASRSYSHLD